jgi:hypothetical protein
MSKNVETNYMDLQVLVARLSKLSYEKLTLLEEFITFQEGECSQAPCLDSRSADS